MHYKIEGTIKRNKGRFIVFAVLWLFMAIVLVAPIAYAQHNATIDGAFNFGEFITQLAGTYTKLGEVVRKHRNLLQRILWNAMEIYFHICNINVYRFCKNST